MYQKTSYDNATYYIGFAPLFTQGLKHGLIKYPAQAGLRAFSHLSLFPLSGLQGSQTAMGTFLSMIRLCTFIYLQSSQTDAEPEPSLYALCTFIYLQVSQTSDTPSADKLSLYTFIYLQCSQTPVIPAIFYCLLYTFIYLQGSQTHFGNLSVFN